MTSWLVGGAGVVLLGGMGISIGAPGWFAAVPYRRAEALHDPAACEVTLDDLPPRHRRELASVLAAGLASAAITFLAVAQARIVRDRALDATPLTIQMAAAPESPAPLLLPRERPAAARRRVAPSPVQLASSRVQLASSPIQLEPPPVQPLASSRSPRLVTQVAEMVRPASSPRKGPGALTRVLFGSGQYRVQPFPTVSEQN